MAEQNLSRRKKPVFLLALSILLSAGGVAAFIYLFVLDFNIYWLFLSPIIIALYQVPAAFVLWLYKRKRGTPDKQTENGGGRPEPRRP